MPLMAHNFFCFKNKFQTVWAVILNSIPLLIAPVLHLFINLPGTSANPSVFFRKQPHDLILVKSLDDSVFD